MLTDLEGVYMSDRENGNHGPNGFSVSIVPAIRRLGVGGLSGTYYWNPGSPDSPSFTVTGIAGMGKDVNSTGYRFPGILGLLSRLGLGAGPVFLRDGMTSKDTLGPGITANQSTMIPSVAINSTFPRDKGGPPRVTSIEGGVSSNIGTYRAGTYTASGQQIADTLAKVGSPITPAMGPDDELSPFARTLRSGVGTVGAPSEPPVRYVSSPYLNSLGKGMGDWRSSTEPIVLGRQHRLRRRRSPAGCTGSCWTTCATIKTSDVPVAETAFRPCSNFDELINMKLEATN